MKNNCFVEISKHLGVSKSTISKAFRHCGGVDSGTRLAVLNEISKQNIKPEGTCDIYQIYPATPSYLWNGIGTIPDFGQHHILTKYNVITKVNDSSVVMNYIEEAHHMNAKVLIITATISHEIEELLRKMAKNCFIIFLSERCDMTNGFYIGSDAFVDGFRVGEAYLNQYAGCRVLIPSPKMNGNTRIRINGFRKALCDGGIEDSVIREVPFDSNFMNDMKLFPSKLANHLNDCILPAVEEKLCLYFPAGGDQIFSAISKAGLQEKVVCMGHDIPSKDAKTDAVLCMQDILAQRNAAYDTALSYLLTGMYPKSKHIFLPSKLQIINNNGSKCS